jgi:single-strand DNA-binding protein
MYNKVILVGNLTRDIELRYSQGGMGISKTALATSRKFTVNGEKKEEICFVDITFFGRSAEVANQYLRKGSKILVEGRLNFEQWVDQNGQKRSKHSVTVETMQMLDSKSDNNSGGGYNAPMGIEEESYGAPTQGRQQGYQQPAKQASYPPPQQPSYSNATAQSRQMPSTNDVPVIDIDEDEIPF